jgi:hypothetical protein
VTVEDLNGISWFRADFQGADSSRLKSTVFLKLLEESHEMMIVIVIFEEIVPGCVIDSFDISLKS